MDDSTGEKIGWTWGWAGGFIWVAALSVLFLVQGKCSQGLLGTALAAAAAACIILLVPWRFPATPYWKLMLTPYGMFFLSIGWAAWAFGGLASFGLSWRSLLWLVPLLLPFGSMSTRTWADGQKDPRRGRPALRKT